MQKQIVLVGVGGQGILFATEVLAETALRLGHEVIGSETHGMSQRGGSVISHLKIGEFPSPLVRQGMADILIALDESEAYKSLGFLQDGGLCFVNAADGSFPHKSVRDYIAAHSLHCYAIDADGLAGEISAPAVANTLLLGFAASQRVFPFTFDEISETISLVGRKQLHEVNMQALQRGAEIAKLREGA